MSRSGQSGLGDGLKVYLEEVRRISPPNGKEGERLLRRARRGDARAADQVVLMHLGLVAEVVQERCRNLGRVPQLLEDGNLALAQAVGSFDASVGQDFRTYARSHVLRAIT